jgi:predicted kinase
MLIVLSGLPGTGKTTIAKILARQRKATYLRLDTIEQAIQSSVIGQTDLGPLGYVISYELAMSNLCLGCTVVIDAVNPLNEIRERWREIAENAGSGIVEVEIVCSDQQEHQRRVESRKADILGHRLPGWDEVQSRLYEPWTSDRLVIDSAKLSANDAASKILEALEFR